MTHIPLESQGHRGGINEQELKSKEWEMEAFDGSFDIPKLCSSFNLSNSRTFGC